MIHDHHLNNPIKLIDKVSIEHNLSDTIFEFLLNKNLKSFTENDDILSASPMLDNLDNKYLSTHISGTSATGSTRKSIIGSNGATTNDAGNTGTYI